MPIFYPDVLEQFIPARRFSYTERDVILYALGIGMGADPLEERELPFVFERGLCVVPTAATVLSSVLPGSRPDYQVPEGLRLSIPNPVKVLHGEQKVELHRPLPPAGSFTVEERIVAAVDKGPDKGAILLKEVIWRDDEGDPVATLSHSTFARGDGGFGGPSTGAPDPHPRPDRAPDQSVDLATAPNQALIYRLNGDDNPLHADPAFARRAGFDRPILHGLCTYGITCRAVLAAIAEYNSEAVVSHELRFSAPVYPGDVVTVDMWRQGHDVAFEARVKARDAVVCRNGRTVLKRA